MAGPFRTAIPLCTEAKISWNRAHRGSSAWPASIANHAISLTETDNAIYPALHTGHSIVQYQHCITDKHNSWFLFDDARIHWRLNTDCFLSLDPASDHSNVLQAGEDPVKAGESSVVYKMPSRGEIIRDDFQILGQWTRSVLVWSSIWKSLSLILNVVLSIEIGSNRF